MQTLKEHSGCVCALLGLPTKSSSGGLEFASSAYDGTIKIWNSGFDSDKYDYHVKKELRVEPGDSIYINSLVLLPDSGQIATAAFDENKIKIWSLATFDLVKTFETGANDSDAILLPLPGERLAACASEEDSVEIWDLKKMKCVQILKVHAPIWSLVSLPDSVIASGCADGYVYFWSLNCDSE